MDMNGCMGTGQYALCTPGGGGGKCPMGKMCRKSNDLGGNHGFCN
jgi:hypothetical protein